MQHTAIELATATWKFTWRCSPDHLDEPLKMAQPQRILIIGDLFHESLADDEIASVFGVMAAAPQHRFIVLTKRAERMREWFAASFGLESAEETAAREASERFKVIWDARGMNPWNYLPGAFPIKGQDRRPWPGWPLPNVALGVSVEDQTTADERIPHLLATPAACRVVSYEPALGPLDFTNDNMAAGDHNWLNGENYDHSIDGTPREQPLRPRIDWIIIGGESGPEARPCGVAWIRSAVEQCRDAGVACLVKQLGARPYDDDLCTPYATGYEGTCDCDPEVGCEGKWLRLIDPRGADPAEWPEDLRVREIPEAMRLPGELSLLDTFRSPLGGHRVRPALVMRVRPRVVIGDLGFDMDQPGTAVRCFMREGDDFGNSYWAFHKKYCDKPVIALFKTLEREVDK